MDFGFLSKISKFWNFLRIQLNFSASCALKSKNWPLFMFSILNLNDLNWKYDDGFSTKKVSELLFENAK